MTHEDAGHYAAKHSKDTKINPETAEAIKLWASDKKIGCAVAHKIAGDLDIVPIEVGTAIDLLEYRIIRCQLGLFGYDPKTKIVKPAGEVSPELKKAIHENMKNNRLSCLSCWKIAKQLNLRKMAVSAACETLEIKLYKCQLGAF